MRGIVIACPQKYQDLCLQNIESLRAEHDCHLPIEIWEIGQEIDPDVKEKMQAVTNVSFKNVADYCENPDHWRGFQVKVFALHHCAFDEAILCDADVTFFKNPEIVFSDTHYQSTGAYFFRDQEEWQFCYLSDWNKCKFHNLDFFQKRKQFIRTLIPQKTDVFPKEWAYIYDEDVPANPVKEALQESGVVYIHREIHAESMKHIFKLNENHSETYEYVWGDKETFWIGCVMADKAFYFNPESGYTHDGKLKHNYRGEVFWQQK